MKKTRIAITAVFIVCTLIYMKYRIDSGNVGDRMGPEIHMDEDTVYVPSNASEEEILAGVTAVDAKDGDVSGNLFVEQLSNFVERGRRNATIAAIDSDNHVTKTTRTVIYTDYRPPRFELTAPLKFNVDDITLLDNLTASDVIDGDLTDKIKVSDRYSISASIPGDYPMLFSVTNSAGDVTELPVTVMVRDTSAESKAEPLIFLSPCIVNVAQGKTVDLFETVKYVKLGNYVYRQDAEGVLRTDSDWKRLNIPEKLTEDDMRVEGTVDYTTPGVYELEFHFTDFEGRDGYSRLIISVY